MVAARDTVRPVRVFAARDAERETGVVLRDFVRTAVVGRVVRAAIDCGAVRVKDVARGMTVVGAERVVTFFVAVRGSAVADVAAVRAFVPPERVVAVVDFCDWMMLFVPRDGVVTETFVAVLRDAARAISS